MKVLMVTHSYNFGPQIKGPARLSAKLMEQELKRAGMTYEYCTFTKKNLWNAIKNGCGYIIIFTAETIEVASTFMGDDKPGMMDRMYSELYKMEKIVPIYPPISSMELNFSKMYLTLLPNKTKLFMPHTKYFMYYRATINENLSNIHTYFQKHNIFKIVIKFGYSGDTRNVYIYSTESILNETVKSTILKEMTYHRKMIGKTFLIIIQPFNPMVANRLTEYRIIMVDGIPSPIAAFGFRLTPKNKRIYIPSIEMDPECNEEHANILTLAKYGYSMLSKYIRMKLVVVRIDITWTILEDGNKHYYINEIENLTGTFYFGIPYQPKEASRLNRITDYYDCNPSICQPYPEWFQRNMANAFVKRILTHT